MDIRTGQAIMVILTMAAVITVIRTVKRFRDLTGRL